MTYLILLLTFVSFLNIPTNAQVVAGETRYAVGPGRIMRDFEDNGSLSKTKFHVVDLPILAVATQTGSATVGYKPKSICIRNPLRNTGAGSGTTALNRGSGAIMEVVWNVKKGPANIGGDLTLTDDCLRANSGSKLVINDLCSGSGCYTHLIATTASMPTWGNAEFLSVTLRDNPTSAFRATLDVRIKDINGE